MNIIKPLSQSITFSATPNTVNNATLVYITGSIHGTTHNTLITITSNTGVVRGSFALPPEQYIALEKVATDTITANVDIIATKIAYKS